MKRTLLAFLFTILFSCFNLRADDSDFICARWDLYSYSFGSLEIEIIPGNVYAVISVDEDDAYLGIMGTDKELLDIYMLLDLSYSGSEMIAGITFDVFDSIVVSVTDDFEGELTLYMNRSGDSDMIDICLGAETMAYIGEQVVPNAVSRLKKLGSLIDSGSTNIAKALQRAF